jgi:hypothetical protein
MADEDGMSRALGGMDRADEVGMTHDRWGGDIGIIDVEPPKPPPRWLLRLRALMGKRQNSEAQPR